MPTPEECLQRPPNSISRLAPGTHLPSRISVLLGNGLGVTLRVQVPNKHILSLILSYFTTILNPSTELLGPLDPKG